jgi:exosome complex component RRP4
VIKKVNQPTIHFLSEENIFIISLIEKYLHSDVIVAKNGLIWINARKENIQRVVEIIEFIDENPFMHNLVKKVQSIIINPRGNLSE